MPEPCIITIEASGKVTVDWDPALPDGPHKSSSVEALAAGALLGIGRALTGKGHDEMVRLLATFEKAKNGWGPCTKGDIGKWLFLGVYSKLLFVAQFGGFTGYRIIELSGGFR